MWLRVLYEIMCMYLAEVAELAQAVHIPKKKQQKIGIVGIVIFMDKVYRFYAYNNLWCGDDEEGGVVV